MTRRNLVQAASAAVSAGSLAGASPKPALIDMVLIKMRNGMVNQRQLMTEYLGKAYLPALKRAGVKVVGVFSSTIAPEAPFFMALASHASFAEMEAREARLGADAELRKATAELLKQTPTPYVRMERSLLRGFSTVPDIEVPPLEGRKSNRIFEVRIYESNNQETLRRKVGMFDNGEIAIFRKTGLQPVFFGETIFGRNMPNLTYMLAFDDLAAREKNWRAFVSHPEWVKLRATPGLSDAEIVSNISNMILSPLPFSDIR
jgi:hypothetical protein